MTFCNRGWLSLKIKSTHFFLYPYFALLFKDDYANDVATPGCNFELPLGLYYPFSITP
jgi:hypothetical protein